MRFFCPFTLRMNLSAIALVIAIPVSITGCQVRCLDFADDMADGAALIDGARSCVEKNGALLGFLLSAIVAPSGAASSLNRFRGPDRLRIPDPYREPPLMPPKPPCAA